MPGFGTSTFGVSAFGSGAEGAEVMAETWTVNGVDLNTFAWKIEKGEGLASTPPLLDLDVPIPARHGVLRATRQMYGPGELVLNMWVTGVDPTTGLIPGGSTDVDQYHTRVDTLARLLHAPVLTIVHTRPDGTARQATGRLTGSLDFTREVSSPLFGRFSAAVRLHDAFWSDTVDVSQTFSAATGTASALTAFGAATAPMSDLTVQFTGPVNNPQLAQMSTGTLIAYDAILSFGRILTINTDTLQLGVATGAAWTPDVSKLRFFGSRGWQLTPETTGTNPPVVLFTHTTGVAASVTITGRRKYLTP